MKTEQANQGEPAVLLKHIDVSPVALLPKTALLGDALRLFLQDESAAVVLTGAQQQPAGLLTRQALSTALEPEAALDHPLAAFPCEPALIMPDTTRLADAVAALPASGPALVLVSVGATIAGLVTGAQLREALTRPQLINRQQLLDALLATTPDLYFLISRDGVYLGYHAGPGDRLYATPDAFLGRTVDEILPPDAAATFRHHLELAFERQESVLYEYDLAMPTGPARFQAHLSPTAGRDACFVIIRDISAAHRNAMLLRERVKERDCLQRIFTLTEAATGNLEDLFRQVLAEIPVGFQRPATVSAAIEWDGVRLAGNHFDSAAPCLSVTVQTGNQKTLRLLVADHHGDAFLPEEQDLVQDIVKRLVLAIDRITANREIARQQTILSTMFEQTRDAVLLMDPDSGRFVHFNDNACAGLGYSREEFARLRVSDFQAQHSTSHIARNLGATVAGKPLSFETLYRHRDGHLVNVAVTLRLISAGQEKLISAVWSDITEQKAHEKRMEETTARLQLYSGLLNRISRLETEHADDFATRIAATTELLAGRLGVDRVAIWEFGTAPASLNCLDLFDASSNGHSHGSRPFVEGVRQFHALLQSTGYIASSDPLHDHRTRDLVENYLRPNRISALLVCPILAGERLLGMVSFEQVARTYDWQPDEITFAGQVADKVGITLLNRDRDTALAKLAAYQQRLEDLVTSRTSDLETALQEQRAILNTADIGIALIEHRTVLRCNSALEALFGYAPDEMTGESTRIWYRSESDFRNFGQRIQAAFEKQGYYQGNRNFLHKDGSRVWTRVTARPLQGDGATERLVATFTDLSAERRAARTLKRAKKAAEAASRAKSDFLANMSHEIRTPMNAIIGMCHLALRTPLSDQQRDYLDHIQRSSKHLLDIINDILDLSKIEAGKMTLEHEAFDLAAVLQQVTDLVGEALRDKGLELVVSSAAEVPSHLVGDALRLRQILLNYVGNAIKFTEQGRITLAIRVEETSRHHVLLRFDVTDTGIGMTSEQQQQLFHSFRQVDMSSKRKFGGTGLGLSICKQLTTLMGGSVGVKSAPGEGSRFWFTARLELAAAPAAGAASEAAGEPPLTSDDAAAGTARVRILLAEDNRVNREVGVGLLQAAGYQVDTAEDGRQVLARLEKQHYDLILMDLQMPVMDGFEATGKIRADQRWQQIPIIALSANVMRKDREACQAAGMNDFVSKPIDPTHLFAVLQRWLAPQQRPTPGPPPPPPVRQHGLLPTAIRGLDIGAGLQVMRGKTHLYLKVLRIIQNDYRDKTTELDAALAAGDDRAAERLVHSVKGVAGNVGAQQLMTSAAALEAALRNASARSTLEPLVTAFGRELEDLIDELDRHFPPGGDTPAETVADEERQRRCSELVTLLQNDNPAALEYYERHQQLFGACFGEQRDRLRTAIRSFDFAGALKIIAATGTESPPPPAADAS